MRSYWYITSKHKYPGGTKDVQAARMLHPAYSVIEMRRPATPQEIDQCRFEYLGFITKQEMDHKLDKVKSKYLREYELRRCRD